MMNFLRDSRGNAVIMAALFFPVVLGGAALVVDVADLRYSKSRLQNAADSAALAAASYLPATASATNVATSMAAKNVPASFGTVVGSNDVTFGTYSASSKTFTVSATGINAVKVVAHRSAAGGNAAPTFFARIFGIQSADISASTIAVGTGGTPCVFALDSSASAAFSTSGSGTVNVPNCGIYVNSNSATALQAGTSGIISAKSIQVVGGYTAGNYSPAPSPYQPVIPDPLANIPEPVAPTTCTYSNASFNNSQTLPGGSVYCGKIKFNSDVNFGAGTHYFVNAQVTTNSNINVTGTNVMLYFDNKSSFKSTGTGIFSLVAPQSGTYQGIAIFGSRTGSMSTFTFQGSKNYSVYGTIYLPKAFVTFYGTADLTVNSKAGYVIAQKFLYQGDSSFTFDTFGYASPTGLKNSQIALVQ